MVDQSEPQSPTSVARATATDNRPAVQADPRVLDEIVRRLVAALAPERIYLFGSRARGDATEDSDYDVLVVVPQKVERPYELDQQALAALWDVRILVDVLVMARDRFESLVTVAASLPATVAREGQLLYDVSGGRRAA